MIEQKNKRLEKNEKFGKNSKLLLKRFEKKNFCKFLITDKKIKMRKKSKNQCIIKEDSSSKNSQKRIVFNKCECFIESSFIVLML